jgi:RHS repeat-associated protein
MEGPWMNDAAALDNRYKFNSIERVQDFGLNVDMAMYRAYDPAIGRWWQADPIAKAWENPYAAMYNNPMNWSDFNGADATPSGMRNDTTPQRDWANSHIPKFNYYVGASGGAISTYTPTFWDKAKESDNALTRLGYSTADFFYTVPQAFNPFDTRVSHLGHGDLTQNEAQDLTAAVATTALVVGLAPKVLKTIQTFFWRSTVPKILNSAQFGKIIGWGEGQTAEAVRQTINVTRTLTPSQVKRWAKQGLTKEWVKEQLAKYSSALARGGDKLKNTQLVRRKELMEKILKLWR